MMKFCYLIIFSFFVFGSLWASHEAGSKLVSLLKAQSRWEYVAFPLRVIIIPAQENKKYSSIVKNGFRLSTSDQELLKEAEFSTNEDDHLIIESNNRRLTFGIIGASSETLEKSFLSFDYLKKVLTSEYTEESFSGFTSEELRELLPGIMLKANLLHGFSDYFIFEGQYTRGYACYRSSDSHIYGQIWIGELVFTYSVSNYIGNEWKNFIVNYLSKFKALEKETKD